MHPADTLTRISLERHRERARLVSRPPDGPSSTRVRIAAILRTVADRLDTRPADFNLRGRELPSR